MKLIPNIFGGIFIVASLVNCAAAQTQDIDTVGPLTQAHAQTDAQKLLAERARLTRDAAVKGNENICDKTLGALIASYRAPGEGRFDPTTGKFFIRIVETVLDYGFRSNGTVKAVFYEHSYVGDRASTKISRREKAYFASGHDRYDEGVRSIVYTQGDRPAPILSQGRCFFTANIDPR